MRRLVRLNALSVAKFLVALQAGPCTSQELAEESGLHICTMRRWIKELRKHKLIHIGSWSKRWPVYEWGDGKDARPRIKPDRQVQADYRERRRMRDMARAVAGR